MDDQQRQPPKPAVAACTHCRKRKRRCDRVQPRCSLCEATNKRCIYQVSGASSLDEAATAPDRLARLESTLANHTRVIQSIEEQLRERNEPASTGVTPSTGINSREGFAPVARTGTFDTASLVDDLAPMTIPIGHATTTSNLLQSKPVRAILGDYPGDLFLRVEQKRSLPEQLSLVICDLDTCPLPTLESSSFYPLLNQYFTAVHPIYPVLDQDEVGSTCNILDGQTAAWTTESVIVMLVLAVAEASMEPYPGQGNDWLPGISYFRPAVQYLLRTWPAVHHTDVHLSQAMFLVALYYSYLCRPLQAWRMVHMAATNIQHAFLQSQSPHTLDQALIRTCWAIFVMECDLVAEYHLPRSGIENLVDQLPFPEPGNEAQIYFSSWLAKVSARRLLNRIHCTTYKSFIFSSVTDSQFPQRLSVLADELTHQLQTWWELIPASAKPNLNKMNPTTEEAALMLRYHACGDIIGRPFLYYVCTLPPAADCLENGILDQALRCLQHSREFIRIVPSVLERPSPLTDICLHSTLAAVVNLSVASYSPLLRDYVPDVESMEDEANRIIQCWAFPGFSAETIRQLVITLKEKGAILRLITDK